MFACSFDVHGCRGELPVLYYHYYYYYHDYYGCHYSGASTWRLYLLVGAVSCLDESVSRDGGLQLALCLLCVLGFRNLVSCCACLAGRVQAKLVCLTT